MPELDGKGSATFLFIRRAKIIFELVMLTLLCVVIITAVREFVTRPFVTSGDSMVPTFNTNEYLVMDEVTYRYHTPERGDVIIFRYPL
jgi:signal peptidase I